MAGIADEYRARAKEYRQLAELAANLSVAEELTRLAAEYEREAQRIDRSQPGRSSTSQ
jgi:hypothetical protein